MSLWSVPAWAAPKIGPTALLVPRTGTHAALGRSMERAARLAQGAAAPSGLIVIDTGDSPAGAAAAARAAVKARAAIVIGPVFAPQVRPVIGVIGRRLPVVAFSNDTALIESGAFLIGVTAQQGL